MSYAPEKQTEVPLEFDPHSFPLPARSVMAGAPNVCLAVLSPDCDNVGDTLDVHAGVSARCLVQAHNLLSDTNTKLVIATPDGLPAALFSEDDWHESWVRKHKQMFVAPLRLQDLHESDYACLFLPTALGALSDLANNALLGSLVDSFLARKKPLCAIGHGIAGLCKATSSTGVWSLRGRCLTATSIFETAQLPYFGRLPLIIEDFIKDNGGIYTASEGDGVHVVVDGCLVTGQNVPSTSLAVQNMLWLRSELTSRSAARSSGQS